VQPVADGEQFIRQFCGSTAAEMLSSGAAQTGILALQNSLELHILQIGGHELPSIGVCAWKLKLVDLSPAVKRVYWLEVSATRAGNRLRPCAQAAAREGRGYSHGGGDRGAPFWATSNCRTRGAAEASDELLTRG
jgi:hypothetical protein